MKTIPRIIISTLLLLVGCNKSPSDYSAYSSLDNMIQDTGKPIEQILPLDTGGYSQPKIIISTEEDTVLSAIGSVATGEYDHTTTPEMEQNGWKLSKVRGYVYTHIYQDLGIKVTTPPLYEPYFYDLTKGPILKRINNLVYKSGTTNLGGEYIQMFEKDPNESLKSVIEKNYLGKGCIAYNRMENGYDFKKDSRFQYHGWVGTDINNFYDITGPDGSLGSDVECRPDKEFPQNQSIIMFVQPLTHKDRYYKISMGDGCAPGPCTIFGNIEFF